MEAGRELDALVAEKVMGLTLLSHSVAPCPYCKEDMRFCGERSWCSQCQEWRYGPAKEYSLEIADAWEVVEKLLGRFQFALNSPEDGEDWFAEFGAWSAKTYRAHDATEGTVSLAICLAALKAVGVKL